MMKRPKKCMYVKDEGWYAQGLCSTLFYVLRMNEEDDLLHCVGCRPPHYSCVQYALTLDLDPASTHTACSAVLSSTN
jgi:hypothetical protein